MIWSNGNLTMTKELTFSSPMKMMLMMICMPNINLNLNTGIASTLRLSFSSNTSVPSIHSLFTPFETAKKVWDYLVEQYSSVDGANEY